MDKLKLKVAGLSYSENQADAYALILDEEDGLGRRLPVVIGKSEAQAIAVQLENIRSMRPQTHDLTKTIVELLEAQFVEVDIIKLIEGVFYAEICLMKDKHVFRIDARVSDAVALAVRFEAPIFTTEEILEKAAFKITLSEEEEEEQTSIISKKKEGKEVFQGYTLKQIDMMLSEAIREENYERAALLKKELERREKKN